VLEEQDPDKLEDALRFMYAGNCTSRFAFSRKLRLLIEVAVNHLNDKFDGSSATLNFCAMLKVAVPLYALGQYLQLDAMCQEITRRISQYNKTQARDLQQGWNQPVWVRADKNKNAPEISTETQIQFTSLAKEAYDMPKMGDEKISSIRKPFRDYLVFRRFAYLTDSGFLDMLTAEVPSLVAEIIQDMMEYGSPATLPPQPSRRRCEKCRKDPLSQRRGRSDSGSSNFWMTSEVCYECSVSED
jgi:hypothetical protein